jgi:hypothetical protein
MIIPNEPGLLARRHPISTGRGIFSPPPSGSFALLSASIEAFCAFEPVEHAAFVRVAGCSAVMADRGPLASSVSPVVRRPRPVPVPVSAQRAKCTFGPARVSPNAHKARWRRAAVSVAQRAKCAFGSALTCPKAHKARQRYPRAQPPGVRGTRW